MSEDTEKANLLAVGIFDILSPAIKEVDTKVNEVRYGTTAYSTMHTSSVVSRDRRDGFALVRNLTCAKTRSVARGDGMVNIAQMGCYP